MNEKIDRFLLWPFFRVQPFPIKIWPLAFKYLHSTDSFVNIPGVENNRSWVFSFTIRTEAGVLLLQLKYWPLIMTANWPMRSQHGAVLTNQTPHGLIIIYLVASQQWVAASARADHYISHCSSSASELRCPAKTWCNSFYREQKHWTSLLALTQFEQDV